MIDRWNQTIKTWITACDISKICRLTTQNEERIVWVFIAMFYAIYDHRTQILQNFFFSNLDGFRLINQGLRMNMANANAGANVIFERKWGIYCMFIIFSVTSCEANTILKFLLTYNFEVICNWLQYQSGIETTYVCTCFSSGIRSWRWRLYMDDKTTYYDIYNYSQLFTN